MLRRLISHWPLLALVAVYAASLILFCTSMLSTSTVMRTIATEPCAATAAGPLVDQVVLVLIDAMRPDFVLGALRPFARTGGQCDVHGDTSLAAIAHERRYTGPTLHYMESSLRSQTDASIGFFLVADAPTTTAQRIKAIATGTMPAFLEAGSNFNSDAIQVDSIVRQMNGSAVLLGDDTWEKLFPNTAARRHWKRAVGIPSFDVADFHTNDDAVLQEIFMVLESETPEAAGRHGSGRAKREEEEEEKEEAAQLIVAHFLGIDHVGHRIDSDNPSMNGKIQQLDLMLRNVSLTLQRRPTAARTMLLVMGDHGMTNSGDHGGGSAQETDTFLFAQYFPAPLEQDAPLTSQRETRAALGDNMDAALRLLQQRWEDRVDAEFDRLRSCRAAAGVPAERLGATYQVDVTSTVAVLLGKPIPYSSFGRVIPEVLALANASVDVAAVEQCNLQQLERYFRESEMKVPRDASWLRAGAAAGGLSVAQRLADMSFYARRTRTDMSRGGMFAGSTGLLLCAMALLWSPTVRAYLAPRRSGWTMRWTALVLVLRLCTVFSNSFVVNEDSEVLGLLSTLLLALLLPRVIDVWRRAPQGHQKGGGFFKRIVLLLRQQWQLQRRGGSLLFLCTLLLAIRLCVPVLLRYRAHITHTVETESAVDRFVARHPRLGIERLGILTAALLWMSLYPSAVRRSLVVATCCAVAAAYHVPVLHHAVPLLCAAACPYVHRVWGLRSRVVDGPSASPVAASSYRYFVLVLWLASLCNARVATAVVVAAYGVCLPRLCAALRGEPLLTQAVVLHLFAFVGFFAEGHQCMLNTIDWNASFVGMPCYSLYAGGVLVLSRTFHAFLLVPIALQVAAEDDDGAARARSKKSDEPRELKGGAVSATVVITAYLHLLLVQSAISCFNGYIQKTHLMLFPIFCPKLLFDGVIALLTAAAVVVVALMQNRSP